MLIIKSIYWEQSNSKELIYKFPFNNISLDSILTINEVKEAYFFKNGMLCDVFISGRYILSSANLAILLRIINLDGRCLAGVIIAIITSIFFIIASINNNINECVSAFVGENFKIKTMEKLYNKNNNLVLCRTIRKSSSRNIKKMAITLKEGVSLIHGCEKLLLVQYDYLIKKHIGQKDYLSTQRIINEYKANMVQPRK